MLLLADINSCGNVKQFPYVSLPLITFPYSQKGDKKSSPLYT